MTEKLSEEMKKYIEEVYQPTPQKVQEWFKKMKTLESFESERDTFILKFVDEQNRANLAEMERDGAEAEVKTLTQQLWESETLLASEIKLYHKEKARLAKAQKLSFPRPMRQWDDTWVYDTDEINKWRERFKTVLKGDGAPCINLPDCDICDHPNCKDRVKKSLESSE